MDFALERITVKSADAVAPAVVAARETRGIQFFIVDAPAEAFKPLAAAVRGRDVLLFNATAPEVFADVAKSARVRSCTRFRAWQ